MALETLTANIADNRIVSAASATWGDVRGATTGTAGTVTATTVGIGEGLAGTDFAIRRYFCYFTSTATGTVTGATFSFEIVSGSEVANTFHLVETTQSTPVVGDDFNNLSFTSFGSVSTAASGVKTITLNAAGIAYVNTNIGSIIKLGIIGNYDQTNVAPSVEGNYYPLFYSGDELTAQKPTLAITYTTVGGAFFFNLI